MTVDNGKTIIRLRLNVFIATVLFIVYLFFAYFGRNLKFPIFGLTDTELSLIILALYLVIAFYPVILGYKYIYYSDDGPSIILRYYSVGLIKGAQRSIEIDKSRFAGYRKSGGYFSRKIALIQKLDKRTAVYPGVSLTSLSTAEMNRLYKMLDKYAPPSGEDI